MLSEITVCLDCEGEGEIVDFNDTFLGQPGPHGVIEYAKIKPCPRCKGKGYINEIIDWTGDIWPEDEY